MHKIKKNIVLTGMPAVGKSTIGVLLAKRLGMGFVDTDITLQSEQGQSLQALIQAHGLERDTYVLSTPLVLAWQVGRLPYAVLLDAEGVVRARGLVNTREHLESLFEARDHGVASLQEYLGRGGSPRRVA